MHFLDVTDRLRHSVRWTEPVASLKPLGVNARQRLLIAPGSDLGCEGDCGVWLRARDDSDSFAIRRRNRSTGAGRCENIYLAAAAVRMKGAT